MEEMECDVVVIGAGPAGSVSASRLARSGRKVIVLERDIFPRFVIGESLLPVSMEHWEATGLLPAIEAQNYAPKLGARFIRGEHVLDLSFADKFTPGWDRTFQVPRAHFDKVCADATAAQGVDIRYGTRITQVKINGRNGVVVQAEGQEGPMEVKAQRIIDSSGYGGALTRYLDLPFERTSGGRASIFMHVEEEHRDRFPDPMQISFDVLAQDLWFWVIPFSNGTTSIGFVGSPDHFTGMDADLDAGVAKLLERSVRYVDRFKGLSPSEGPTLIRDYTMSVDQLHGPGYALAGNCGGFIDPVFSSGVAIATGSGLMAADLMHRELNGEEVDWQSEYVTPVQEGAAVFRSYVDNWYNGDLQTIFFSERMDPRIKQQIISVLAGYVHDKSNPFVSRHGHILNQLAQLVGAHG